MKVAKRINNNAVLCLDAAGNQVIALGKGLAQAQLNTELDLNLVDHTFYDVETRYIDLMRDLPAECVELAASVVDSARALLPYELSPNIDIALADHIAFAIKRAREHIYLQAPLAYDIQQNYPLEYKIAEYALARIRAELGVDLPHSETAGIALSLVNGAYTAPVATGAAQAPSRDEMLERVCAIVEEQMDVHIEREGFGFARFATHVLYLLQRVESGEAIESQNSGMYAELIRENTAAATCVDCIAALIAKAYGQELTEEEKLYLLLHINRICTHANEGQGSHSGPRNMAHAQI